MGDVIPIANKARGAGPNPHQSGMAASVDFPADPHASGRARCLSCKHEWVAVAPVGTEWLDCPACTLNRGKFIYPFQLPKGEQIWICDCGNDLFELSRAGWLCPNCGVYCSFPKPGE